MKRPLSCRGFTLVELLAAMAILSMMIAFLFAVFNQASKAWLQGENRVETFQAARAALDFMSKELSQAIVNSNLQFLASEDSLAFVAPVSDRTGDGADLIEVVYRQSWRSGWGGTDPTGFFTSTAPPLKLVRRVSQFNENHTNSWDYGSNTVQQVGAKPWDFYIYRDWPETSTSNRTAVLAENIMSLTFQFFDIQGTQWPYWNSTTNGCDGIISNNAWQHEITGKNWNGIGCNIPSGSALWMSNRAPAGVQITLGVIDNRTAARLKFIPPNTQPWTNTVLPSIQYFTTYVAIPNRTP